MSALDKAVPVATVGSPSTNSTVILNITGDAAHTPLVGAMLFMTDTTQRPGDPAGTELALGVVTEVTTTNRNVENPDMRAAGAMLPQLAAQFTGDASDVRQARVNLQACYRMNGDDELWRQAGSSFSTSPTTGVRVGEVTDDVLSEIINDPDLQYLGYMASAATRGRHIKLPLKLRDFQGERGAYHTVVCGLTGAGKSVLVSLMLAAQMKSKEFGHVLIDPQGQWSHEQGLPFSLQGWAAEMGRDVIVARISEDLRLDKDSELFATLLGKTKFTSQLMRMGQENAEILLDELAKVVKKRDDWEAEESESLLRHIAGELQNTVILNRVYATQDKQDRLSAALAELVNDVDRFNEVLRYFKPLHNLFQTTNPAGNPRKSMWATLSAVFDTAARGGNPAPLLILDMSTSDVSWLSSLLSDDEKMDAAEALAILDQDSIKAAILRQTCATLKKASESAFRQGQNLNTQVILDEAWRYAPPPGNAMEKEIEALSRELAGYARDTRKFGIGWTFITQSPRSINSDIWDQVLVRVLGYGLAGPDLDKVAEQLDDRDHLKLYRTFPPPDATNPRVYPFMLTGPVSPLSFTKAPVFLAAYTDFDLFRAENEHWIKPIRASLGLPVLSGAPIRPGAKAAPRITRAPGVVGKKEREKNGERVRANRNTGGVDPSSQIGLVNDPSFGSGLDALDSLSITSSPLGPNGFPIDPNTGLELPF